MASSRLLPSSYNTTTLGDSGGSPDYTAFSTWEEATDNDLVTATAGEVLHVRSDGSPYTVQDFLDNSTTSSSYFRVVMPAPGAEHDGTPNAGVKFTSTGARILQISEDNSVIHDIVMTLSANSGTTRNTVHCAGTNNSFVGVLVDTSTNVGAGDANGIVNAAGTGETNYVVNCLALACDGDNIQKVNPGTGYFYNCDAQNGSGVGFQRDSGTAIAKNCLSDGNTTDFAGTWDAASTDNASGDTSAPGSNAETSVTPSYVDSGNDDFHLASGDTAVKDKGADLSADGAFPFDDDIDGDTITTWSIGFDSIVGAAGPALRHPYQPYRTLLTM